MGAATEGGYLGNDVQSFFSAVISGAAGFYAVTVTEDAGIGTDLTIQPGQNVQISGDPGLSEAPSWGTGGFVIGEMGSLTLAHLHNLVSLVSVSNGGVTTITDCTISDVLRPAVNSGGRLEFSSMVLPSIVLATTTSRSTSQGKPACWGLAP